MREKERKETGRSGGDVFITRFSLSSFSSMANRPLLQGMPTTTVGRMGLGLAQTQTMLTLVSRVMIVMTLTVAATVATTIYSTTGVVKLNTKVNSGGGIVSQSDLGLFNSSIQYAFQSFLDQLGQAQLDIRNLERRNVTQSSQIMQLQTRVTDLQQANATGVAQLAELLQANQTMSARITQLESDLASAEARLAMILTVDEAADSNALNITFAELLVQVRLVNASLLGLKQLEQVRYDAFVVQDTLIQDQLGGINQTLGAVNQTVIATTTILFAQTASLFSTVGVQGTDIGNLDVVTIDLLGITTSLATRATTLEGTTAGLLATDVLQNATLLGIQTNVSVLFMDASSLFSTVATQATEIGNLDTVTMDLFDITTSLTARVTTLEGATGDLSTMDILQNGTLSALQTQIGQVNASLLHSIEQDAINDAVMLVPVYGNLSLLFGQTSSLLATDATQNAALSTLHTDDIALFASDSSLSDRITVLENTQSAIQQSFNMLNTLDVAQIATLLLDTAAIQDTTANVTTLLNALRMDVVLFQIANNTNCSSAAFDAFYADWLATSYQFGNVTLFFNAFVQQINIHNVTLTSLAAVTNELLSVGFGLLTNYNMMLADLATIEVGCDALDTTFAIQATDLTKNLNSTRDAVHILVLQLGSFGVSDPQVAFELAQTIIEVATIDSRLTTVETKLTNLTTTVTQLGQLVNNQNAVFNLQLINLLSLITSAQSELDSLNSEIIALQLAFGYFVGNQSNLNSAVLAQFQQVFANLSSANVITLTLQAELHSLEANITYQNGISQAQLNQVNATLTTLILQVNTQFALIQGSITGLQAELLAHEIHDDALFGLINSTIATMSNTTANSILSLVTSMTAVQTTVAILVGEVNVLNSEVTSLQLYQNTSSANITSIWVALEADDATEVLQFAAIAANFTAIDASQAAQNANNTALWVRVELDEASNTNTFFTIANNFTSTAATNALQSSEIATLQTFQTSATNTFFDISNNFTAVAVGQAVQNANVTALWVRVELDENANALAQATENVAIGALQAFQTLATNTFLTINNNFTAIALGQAVQDANVTSLWVRLELDEGAYANTFFAIVNNFTTLTNGQSVQNGQIAVLQAFQTFATNNFAIISSNFTMALNNITLLQLEETTEDPTIASLQAFQVLATNTFFTIANNFTTIAVIDVVQSSQISALQAFQTSATNTFFTIANNFTALTAGQAAQNANVTALWVRVELDENANALTDATQNVAIGALQAFQATATNTFFTIANNFTTVTNALAVHSSQIATLQTFQTLATNTFFTISNNFTILTLAQAATNASLTSLWVRLLSDETTYNSEIATLQAFQTTATNTFLTINNNFTAVAVGQASTNANLTSLWVRVELDENANALALATENVAIGALQAFQTTATNNFFTINNNFTALTLGQATTNANLTTLWVRVELDEGSIASQFATVNANIATNTANIAALTTNSVASLSANVSTLFTNMTAIFTRVELDEAFDTSRFLTLTTNVATNTANIATNTANIAINAANISTLFSNLTSLWTQIQLNDIIDNIYLSSYYNNVGGDTITPTESIGYTGSAMTSVAVTKSAGTTNNGFTINIAGPYKILYGAWNNGGANAGQMWQMSLNGVAVTDGYSDNDPGHNMNIKEVFIKLAKNDVIKIFNTGSLTLTPPTTNALVAFIDFMGPFNSANTHPNL